jgi:gas vesicle protein GvpA/GvpJ/GvpM family
VGPVFFRHTGGAVTLAGTDNDLYLIDLLDRLLAGGVVLTGDVTISLAGVDLVQISLRALISSVATLADE